MRQKSFADEGFESYRKSTRRDKFHAGMDRIIPWRELCEAIEPFYPNPKSARRRPIGLERMLRTHFLQHWFNLSDPGVEEDLYDSRAMRRLAGIDLGREAARDETTICKFRHMLEARNFGGQLFALIGEHLQDNGKKVGTGTIADASIIQAPGSTKNREKKRDPEMHQAKKGNQWYFGMKAHVGVDSRSKMIHSVVATATNIHDIRILPDLLHGDETRVWGDSAYTGQREVIREHAPRAQDLTNKMGHRHRVLSEHERAKNRTKPKVWAKIEHPFPSLKRVFGLRWYAPARRLQDDVSSRTTWIIPVWVHLWPHHGASQ